MSFDDLELPLPQRAVQLEPVLGVSQRARLEPQHVRASEHRPADDTRVLQDLEMLRHRRLGHADSARGLAHSCRAEYEPLDDRPANRVREREEAAVEFCLTVHLAVNNIPSARVELTMSTTAQLWSV